MAKKKKCLVKLHPYSYEDIEQLKREFPKDFPSVEDFVEKAVREKVRYINMCKNLERKMTLCMLCGSVMKKNKKDENRLCGDCKDAVRHFYKMLTRKD